MMACRVSCVLLLCLIAVCWDETTATRHEDRLFEELLQNYNKFTIPRPDLNTPLAVHFGFSIQSIWDLDKERKSLTLVSWPIMHWTDYRLAWDASEYDGVEKMDLPAKVLWTPDIELYNSMSVLEHIATTNNVVVDSTGSIAWVPPIRTTSSCDLVTEDAFNCTLKFGSWVHDGYRLDLQLRHDATDSSTFMPYRHYKLVQFDVVRNVQRYECCPEPYVSLTYTLAGERAD